MIRLKAGYQLNEGKTGFTQISDAPQPNLFPYST